VLGRSLVPLWLLATCLLCQNSKPRADRTLVSRAQQVVISNFDAALPNLTLATFLKYETGDRLIDWRESDCDELHRPASPHSDDTRCVTAFSSLSDALVITVTVGVTGDRSRRPALISVSLIDHGLERPMQLIDVPAVAQGHKIPNREPERWPRDWFRPRRIA
jgi:hypothetical protein